jgi:hypothetical protein
MKFTKTKNRFFRCKNRQKYAQKLHLLRALVAKMGKFRLQTANMTMFGQKTAISFVNFLKRGFVFRVNLDGARDGEGDFFGTVLLDNFFCLCYYIIYIWENSAQNRPIGGVCLTRRRERIS